MISLIAGLMKVQKYLWPTEEPEEGDNDEKAEAPNGNIKSSAENGEEMLEETKKDQQNGGIQVSIDKEVKMKKVTQNGSANESHHLEDKQSPEDGKMTEEISVEKDSNKVTDCSTNHMENVLSSETSSEVISLDEESIRNFFGKSIISTPNNSLECLVEDKNNFEQDSSSEHETLVSSPLLLTNEEEPEEIRSSVQTITMHEGRVKSFRYSINSCTSTSQIEANEEAQRENKSDSNIEDTINVNKALTFLLKTETDAGETSEEHLYAETGEHEIGESVKDELLNEEKKLEIKSSSSEKQQTVKEKYATHEMLYISTNANNNSPKSQNIEENKKNGEIEEKKTDAHYPSTESKETNEECSDNFIANNIHKSQMIEDNLKGTEIEEKKTDDLTEPKETNKECSNINYTTKNVHKSQNIEENKNDTETEEKTDASDPIAEPKETNEECNEMECSDISDAANNTPLVFLSRSGDEKNIEWKPNVNASFDTTFISDSVHPLQQLNTSGQSGILEWYGTDADYLDEGSIYRSSIEINKEKVEEICLKTLFVCDNNGEVSIKRNKSVELLSKSDSFLSSQLLEESSDCRSSVSDIRKEISKDSSLTSLISNNANNKTDISPLKSNNTNNKTDITSSNVSNKFSLNNCDENLLTVSKRHKYSCEFGNNIKEDSSLLGLSKFFTDKTNKTYSSSSSTWLSDKSRDRKTLKSNISDSYSEGHNLYNNCLYKETVAVNNNNIFYNKEHILESPNKSIDSYLEDTIDTGDTAEGNKQKLSSSFPLSQEHNYDIEDSKFISNSEQDILSFDMRSEDTTVMKTDISTKIDSFENRMNTGSKIYKFQLETKDTSIKEIPPHKIADDKRIKDSCEFTANNEINKNNNIDLNIKHNIELAFDEKNANQSFLHSNFYQDNPGKTFNLICEKCLSDTSDKINYKYPCYHNTIRYNIMEYEESLLKSVYEKESENIKHSLDINVKEFENGIQSFLVAKEREENIFSSKINVLSEESKTSKENIDIKALETNIKEYENEIFKVYPNVLEKMRGPFQNNSKSKKSSYSSDISDSSLQNNIKEYETGLPLNINQKSNASYILQNNLNAYEKGLSTFFISNPSCDKISHNSRKSLSVSSENMKSASEVAASQNNNQILKSNNNKNEKYSNVQINLLDYEESLKAMIKRKIEQNNANVLLKNLKDYELGISSVCNEYECHNFENHIGEKGQNIFDAILKTLNDRKISLSDNSNVTGCYDTSLDFKEDKSCQIDFYPNFKNIEYEKSNCILENLQFTEIINMPHSSADLEMGKSFSKISKVVEENDEPLPAENNEFSQNDFCNKSIELYAVQFSEDIFQKAKPDIIYRQISTRSDDSDGSGVSSSDRNRNTLHKNDSFEGTHFQKIDIQSKDTSSTYNVDNISSNKSKLDFDVDLTFKNANISTKSIVSNAMDDSEEEDVLRVLESVDFSKYDSDICTAVDVTDSSDVIKSSLVINENVVESELRNSTDTVVEIHSHPEKSIEIENSENVANSISEEFKIPKQNSTESLNSSNDIFKTLESVDQKEFPSDIYTSNCSSASEFINILISEECREPNISNKESSLHEEISELLDQKLKNNKQKTDDSETKQMVTENQSSIIKPQSTVEDKPPVKPPRKRRSASVMCLNDTSFDMSIQSNSLFKPSDLNEQLVKIVPPPRKRKLQNKKYLSYSMTDVSFIELDSNFRKEFDKINLSKSTSQENINRFSTDDLHLAQSISQEMINNIINSSVHSESMPSIKNQKNITLPSQLSAMHASRPIKRASTFSTHDTFTKKYKHNIKRSKSSVSRILKRTFSLKTNSEKQPPCMPNIFKRYLQNRKHKKSMNKLPVIKEETLEPGLKKVESFATIFMRSSLENLSTSGFEGNVNYQSFVRDSFLKFPDECDNSQKRSSITIEFLSQTTRRPLRLKRSSSFIQPTGDAKSFVKRLVTEDSTVSLNPEAISRANELLSKTIKNDEVDSLSYLRRNHSLKARIEKTTLEKRDTKLLTPMSANKLAHKILNRSFKKMKNSFPSLSGQKNNVSENSNGFYNTNLYKSPLSLLKNKNDKDVVEIKSTHERKHEKNVIVHLFKVIKSENKDNVPVTENIIDKNERHYPYKVEQDENLEENEENKENICNGIGETKDYAEDEDKMQESLEKATEILKSLDTLRNLTEKIHHIQHSMQKHSQELIESSLKRDSITGNRNNMYNEMLTKETSLEIGGSDKEPYLVENGNITNGTIQNNVPYYNKTSDGSRLIYIFPLSGNTYKVSHSPEIKTEEPSFTLDNISLKDYIVDVSSSEQQSNLDDSVPNDMLSENASEVSSNNKPILPLYHAPTLQHVVLGQKGQNYINKLDQLPERTSWSVNDEKDEEEVSELHDNKGYTDELPDKEDSSSISSTLSGNDESMETFNFPYVRREGSLDNGSDVRNYATHLNVSNGEDSSGYYSVSITKLENNKESEERNKDKKEVNDNKINNTDKIVNSHKIEENQDKEDDHCNLKPEINYETHPGLSISNEIINFDHKIVEIVEKTDTLSVLESPQITVRTWFQREGHSPPRKLHDELLSSFNDQSDASSTIYQQYEEKSCVKKEDRTQKDRCVEVYPETLRQRQRAMPNKVDIKKWEEQTETNEQKFLPSVKALRNQFENGSNKDVSSPTPTLNSSSGFNSNSYIPSLETLSISSESNSTELETRSHESKPISNFGSYSSIDYIHVQTTFWNPEPLISKLYYLEDIQKLRSKESTFIDIEGYLDKLPCGRKKNTFWNAWKRRYFCAKKGVLYCYQSSQMDVMTMKLPLLGGKLEIMEQDFSNSEEVKKNGTSVMLGIDDEKGHYVVVRCANRKEAEKWKSALESHTVDDFASQYVQPIMYPSPSMLQDTIIIDIGSSSIRAGILSNQPTLPQVFFPALEAMNKESGYKLYGMDAISADVRASSDISFPIRPSNKLSKYSVDLNAVSSLIQKAFEKLSVNPKDYNVQLSVPRVLNPATQAELLKIVFEKYEMKSVNITHQSILALYAYNATSGIVVDIGERTDIVPIIDGYIVNGGVSRLPYGGRRVEEHLRQFLFQRNLPLVNEVESFILRVILEKICYCAQHYNTEKARCIEHPENYEKDVSLSSYFPDSPEYIPFHNITLDFGRFHAAEGIFTPDVWGFDHPGLHKLVHKAIQECSMDVRKEMSKSIFLSGGLTQLPGLAARLTNELDNLTPAAIRPKVHASPYRYHASYIGASVLAASPAFHNSKITRDEWSKDGKNVLRKWAF